MPSDRYQWLLQTAANPPPEDQCAIWPFPLGRSDRGMILFEGRLQTASRVALILHSGQNPPNLLACHGPCHRPTCCNPLHLKWQTSQQNSLDRLRDGTALGPYPADPLRPLCSVEGCFHKCGNGYPDMCSTHWRRHRFKKKRSEILSALSNDFVTTKKAQRLVVSNGGFTVHEPAFIETLNKLVKQGDLQRRGKKYRLAESANGVNGGEAA